ncbi:hypothetical protein DFH28DRAFT_465171 [Melampsora americana]|nr:hypothetical protein DFH28DRAFT_465171 [Melampsora americana]
MSFQTRLILMLLFLNQKALGHSRVICEVNRCEIEDLLSTEKANESSHVIFPDSEVEQLEIPKDLQEKDEKIDKRLIQIRFNQDKFEVVEEKKEIMQENKFSILRPSIEIFEIFKEFFIKESFVIRFKLGFLYSFLRIRYFSWIIERFTLNGFFEICLIHFIWNLLLEVGLNFLF